MKAYVFDRGTSKRANGATNTIMKLAASTLATLLLAASAAFASAPRTEMPGEAATSLGSGQWLVTGGSSNGKVSKAAHLVSPSGARTPLGVELHLARADHTATVLPDGSVMILGGLGEDGKVLRIGEQYFADEGRFHKLTNIPLIPRARHSVTVLTDGRLLIVGGIDEHGKPLHEAEVWNTRSGKVERFDIRLKDARYSHIATLLPDANVLVTGGFTADANAVLLAELFNTRSLSFERAPSSALLNVDAEQAAAAPSVAGTIPHDGAMGQALDKPLSVWFNKPLAFEAANFTLIGPSGVVDADVVSTEGGRLAFVTPKKDLQPDSFYTVFVNRVVDGAGRELPHFAATFRTVGGSSSVPPVRNVPESPPIASDPELWVPQARNFKGDWTTGLPDIPAEAKRAKSKPIAKNGGTHLTGRVLKLSGQPLADTTLRIGTQVAATDADGDFVLSGLTGGAQVLEIDGTTANQEMTRYGYYQTRVELRAEQVNELPYVIWMQKLDPAGTWTIPSPLQQDAVLTTPSIPGLELRLPAGTVIRDRTGKVVTEVSITAIPTDRPPFPLPTDQVPTYFTIQPGSAWISTVDARSLRGAQVVYPNYYSMPAGMEGEFWNYDPRDKGWYVYGLGSVAADGKSVVPNKGVAIYEFTGAMFTVPTDDPPGEPGPPPDPNCPRNSPSGPPGGPGGGGGGSWGNNPSPGGGGCNSGGDPVSLSTGQFTHSERDLFLPDVISIDLVRHYRTLDPNVRAFGIGMSHVYDISLWSSTGYADVNLILPDGGRIYFARTTAGTSYTDAEYQTTAGGEWHKAKLVRSNQRGGWVLTKRDGTEWFFPSFAPLKEIKDVNGNKVVITRRDQNGNDGPITRITSPNGRWIEFTLHSSGRIIEAIDNGGRKFTYVYDPSFQRLEKVIDPKGFERRYTWTASNRIEAIFDPNNNRFVHNTYYDDGRVQQQTLADSSTFTFVYTPTTGAPTKTEVTDRGGKKREVTFDGAGQIVSDSYPVGLPEQQTTSFEYSNGFTSARIDPKGRRTKYAYDAAGNLETITLLDGTADAATARFTYSTTVPLRLQTVDGLMPGTGDTTTFSYFPNGNLERVTDANGNFTRYEYDTQGRVTRVENRLGHASVYTYDGPDLSSITDPLSRTVKFIFDAVGRRTTLIDPLGSTTRTEFDELNRVVRVVNPLGYEVAFGYDSAGNLRTSADERNNTTTYRVTAQGMPSGHTDPLGRIDTLAYYADGRARNFTDRNGQVTGVSYDNRGRVASVGFGATVASPTLYANTVAYTYEPNADSVKQITDSTNGATLSYEFDAFGRIKKETSANGVVTYTFNPDGTRASMTVQGELPVEYDYDAGRRLWRIRQGSQSIAFDYDFANRRTKTTLANGIEMIYVYDYASQLREITYKRQGSTIGNITYDYDVAGRRISQGGSLGSVNLPQPVSTAVHDAANRLTNWNGQTFAYDFNGNLTSDGQRTYVWSARNKLSSLSGSVTATFEYDALGRRSTKAVGGTQTEFVFDGANFVQEKSGNNVKANLLVGGIDQVFLRTTVGSGSTASHFMTDALGSPVALADSLGTTVVTYGYEPYGKSTQVGSSDNSQTYTAREDDGTGLFYYRARYYMPGCGRFISEDPIGLRSGQANNYAYVGGDPIGRIDPSGLHGVCSVTGNNVSITLPINFIGPGATPDNIANAITGIQQRWTGTFGDYNVSMTVDTALPAMNTITLTTGPRTIQPFVNMPNPVGSAPGNQGTWHTDKPALNSWEAAHEAGHLLGLRDQYTGTGTPIPGWENHLMGQALGTTIRPSEVAHVIGLCK